MDDRICLVIPYYESPTGLARSLSSVHLRHDDLIMVVDDGSRRRPASSCCPKEVLDTPVRLVTLERNLGIAGALRAGIHEIPVGYAYIARLDCGDVADRERFTIQREYLNANGQVGLLGTWVDFVDLEGNIRYTLKHPTTRSGIRNGMRVNAAITHPAAMFRRDLYDLVGGYSDRYPAAEDLALFKAMMRRADATNIPIVLVRCLTDDGGISTRQRRTQLRSRIRILVDYFDWHPTSIYGMMRATLQLLTPRSSTTLVRAALSGGRRGGLGRHRS